MKIRAMVIILLALVILFSSFMLVEAKEASKGTTATIPDEGYSHFPEFTTLGAFFVLAGAGAYALLKKRK